MRISFHDGPTTRIDKFFSTGPRWTTAVVCTAALLLGTSSPTKAQCTTGGCTDNATTFSNACDRCTTSCDYLGTLGAGCGPNIACRPNPGRLADYVFGDPCDCAGSGGGCGFCGGPGCGGNFWNKLCGGGCPGGLASGLTRLLFGSDEGCCDGGCGEAAYVEGDFGDESYVDGGCANSGTGLGLAMGGAVGLLGHGGAGCFSNGEPGAGYVGHREPPNLCGMPAPTYPVPYAVPQHVGYTQFTYPPFMPHHSLPHYRHTYSYRHAPGMSRTTVHWRSPVGRDILAKLHHMIELPR